MSRLLRAWRTVTSWNRRPPNGDLDRELRLHLELETEQDHVAGMGAEEAARRARVQLGNRPLIAEDMRAAWRWAWLDDLRLDLRLAARLLAKHWRFSALAVLVLSLATGANTALFSVANAVLLKPTSRSISPDSSSGSTATTGRTSRTTSIATTGTR